ncbi:MAG TPA: hypothetical protein VE988_08025 [Gemmataceae bacterium]|nr:hypothetical protein [Gemmataceae bacterium]
MPGSGLAAKGWTLRGIDEDSSKNRTFDYDGRIWVGVTRALAVQLMKGNHRVSYEIKDWLIDYTTKEIWIDAVWDTSAAKYLHTVFAKLKDEPGVPVGDLGAKSKFGNIKTELPPQGNDPPFVLAAIDTGMRFNTIYNFGRIAIDQLTGEDLLTGRALTPEGRVNSIAAAVPFFGFANWARDIGSDLKGHLPFGDEPLMPKAPPRPGPPPNPGPPLRPREAPPSQERQRLPRRVARGGRPCISIK